MFPAWCADPASMTKYLTLEGRSVRTLLKYLSILVLGVALGAGSLWATIRFMSDSQFVTNGPWRTSLATGSAEAGPYLRLVIAVAGLLALNREEAIYFMAATDSSGEPLSGACTYRVSGIQPPARWWSITAYGDDFYLIPNDQGVYSASPANLVTEDDRFVLDVGPRPSGENWIPTGSARHFDLTLRLYNAGPEVAADPTGIELPAIEKVGC